MAKKILVLSCLIVSLLFSGCASDQPEGKTAAEILYKEALELKDSGRYLLATEKLNTIKSQHPYSFYATHAELLQADILFLQENYIEAAAAYLTFRDFHPKHEKLEYVIFKIAESYFNQLPSTHDRDLTPGLEASKYYDEIVQKFPASQYFPESKAKMEKIQRMVQDKEQYIADFYFKTKVYEAAQIRYQGIVRSFNDPVLLNHAKARIVASSFLQKKYQDCVRFSEEYMSQLESVQQVEVEQTYQKCLVGLKAQESN